MAFALHHDSRIIGDFDQIDRDLQPYRTPEARQALLALQQSEDYPRTLRITIQNGTMSMSALYMYEEAWRGLMALFLHALPDSAFFPKHHRRAENPACGLVPATITSGTVQRSLRRVH